MHLLKYSHYSRHSPTTINAALISDAKASSFFSEEKEKEERKRDGHVNGT